MDDKTYTRLSRAASEDERDRSAFAVLDVVASAASATQAAELALLGGESDAQRAQGEDGCEGGRVVHF